MVLLFALLAAAPPTVLWPRPNLPFVTIAEARTPVIEAFEHRLGELFEDRTLLHLEPLPRAKSAACEADLRCLFELARATPDWNGALLLVSARAGSPHYFSAAMLGPEPSADPRYFDSEPRAIERSDVDVYAAHVLEALGSVLGPSISAPASLELTNLGPGAEVSIDGRRFPAERELRIEGLAPGAHAIEARSAWGVSIERRLELAESQSLAISADAPPTSIGRIAVWSGVLVAAVGLAVTGVAIARGQAADPLDPCFSIGAGSCAPVRFIRTGFDPSAPTEPGGGLLFAPLGVSLAVAGGATAIGAGLVEDGYEVPWASIAIGLAAGLVSYGGFELATRLGP